MHKAIELLMVEGKLGDIRLNQEYFKECKVSHHWSVVKNDIAVRYSLHNRDEYALTTLPDIILISISVLWENNAELLKQIKYDATLAHIPIVILTAFKGENASLDDDLSISMCVLKPLNLDYLISLVKRLGDFSLTVVRTESIPKHDRLELSLYDTKRVIVHQYISNHQLQSWDNEGGRIESVPVSLNEFNETMLNLYRMS